jgi:hypothetical protein
MIMVHVLQYLGAHDIGKVSQVTKRFNSLADAAARMILKSANKNMLSPRLIQDMMENKGSNCYMLHRLSQGRIFQSGGAFSSDVFSEYNPTLKSWSMKADLPNPRDNSDAVMSKIGFLILGGDNDESSSSLDVYNHVLEMWMNSVNLPHSIRRTAAVVVNDHLLIIGGESSDADTESAIVYSAKLEDIETM